MLKPIVQSAPLKPEFRLAQAISDFEMDLSSEQKAEIRAHRQAAPSLEDILRFVAKFNQNITKEGIRRCYGPRLTNFLEGVQTFVPLGDTLISGLGRGIWTVVRFSVQSVTGVGIQHSSYLDKLTNIFMVAGRSMPRHHNMVWLFPQSTLLQAHLTEYFIVVAKLCHKIVITSQSSGFQQLLNSYSNPLVTLVKDLEKWAAAIKDEVMIQSIALVKSEKEANSLRLSRLYAQRDRDATLAKWKVVQFEVLLRESAPKVKEHANFLRRVWPYFWKNKTTTKISLVARDAKELRAKETVRLGILRRCSEFNHQTLWKQIRKEGTTNLFLDDELYVQWKRGSNSCTHVFSGKLGSGKSVLLANLVDDLYITLKPGQQYITYFFCHHRVKESLLARTIIGSIARQLFEDRHDIVDAAVDSIIDWDIDEIVGLVKKGFLGSTKPIYLVLDGLDQCESDQQEIILKTIKALQESIKILLCISARWEPDQNPIPQMGELSSLTTYKIPEDNPDIVAFIDTEINDCISSGRLTISSREIIPIVKELLASKSEGMFLWASLSLKMLCSQPSEHDILQALQDLPLPNNLPEVYSRLLSRDRNTNKHYQEAILQLVAVAIRPLKIQELQEALSVEVGNTEWNPTRLINNMSALLACCSGVIIVDEEELTVRFVHDSARQYLTNTTTNYPYGFSTSTAEIRMAQIVTTYLNYVAFDAQVSTTVIPKIDAEPIISSILTTAKNSSTVLGSLVYGFGKSDFKSSFDIGKVFAETAMRAKICKVTSKCLEDYAKQYWFQHSASALDTDTLTLELARKLLNKGLDFPVPSRHTESPLAWLVTQGYSKALELLLDKHANMYDSHGLFDLTLLTALCDAAGRGDRNIISAYLRCPSAVQLMKDISCRRNVNKDLWQDAAMHKQYEIVKLLLDHDSFTRKALGIAYYMLCGYEDPDLPGFCIDEDVSYVLVNSKRFDLNEVSGEESLTPLIVATQRNRTQFVMFLLRQDDIDTKVVDRPGRTALWYAAASGAFDIVKEIIMFNRDSINIPANDGYRPLHIAAKKGHQEIVKFLLEQDEVSWNAKTNMGETALIVAAMYGKEEVVHEILFFATSFDVDQRDSDGRTALSWAAEKGHNSVIEAMLFASKWSCHAFSKCHRGRTPLSYAAESGSEKSVEHVLLLMDNSWTDHEHTDVYGLTPLDYCGKDAVGSDIRTKLEICRLLTNEEKTIQSFDHYR